MGAFSWNLILGAFINICRETKNYIKIGQKYQPLFIWTPKYVSLLPATQIRNKSIFVQHSTFLYWQWDTYLKNTHRMYCCVSIAKMVKQRWHNVMVSCIAYVVPLVGPQYLSTYLKKIKTACHVTLEFFVAVVMNKGLYTTNQRVQLLWNSSIAVLHKCKPTSWTHLPHERGEMESLDIEGFRSHSHFIVWLIHGSSVGIPSSAQCSHAERLWISYSVVNAVYYVVNDCTNQSTYPSTGQHRTSVRLPEGVQCLLQIRPAPEICGTWGLNAQSTLL